MEHKVSMLRHIHRLTATKNHENLQKSLQRNPVDHLSDSPLPLLWGRRNNFLYVKKKLFLINEKISMSDERHV